jgi:feruloyl esterase
MRTSSFAMLLAAAGLCAGQSKPACEKLTSLTLPETTITMAQPMAAGDFTPPSGAAFKNLTGFCRVEATLAPSKDSEIKIEVWLPAAGWNGKFQAIGNGGWSGAIGYPALAKA